MTAFFVGSRAWLKEWLSRGQGLKAGAKQILRLRRRMTTKKQKLDAKAGCKMPKQRRIGDSALIACYQPRVCISWDSSIAAAARPFMVPVTDSQASAAIFGSLK